MFNFQFSIFNLSHHLHHLSYWSVERVASGLFPLPLVVLVYAGYLGCYLWRHSVAESEQAHLRNDLRLSLIAQPYGVGHEFIQRH